MKSGERCPCTARCLMTNPLPVVLTSEEKESVALWELFKSIGPGGTRPQYIPGRKHSPTGENNMDQTGRIDNEREVQRDTPCSIYIYIYIYRYCMYRHRQTDLQIQH